MPKICLYQFCTVGCMQCFPSAFPQLSLIYNFGLGIYCTFGPSANPLRNLNIGYIMDTKKYHCSCGKKYSHKTSLLRHQKRVGCNGITIYDTTEVTSLTNELDSKNEIIAKQKEKIMELMVTREEMTRLLHLKDTELVNLRRDKDNEIAQLTKTKDDEIAFLRSELSNYREDLVSLKPPTNTYNNTIQNNGLIITTAQIKSLLPEFSTAGPIKKITDMSQIFDENADNFLLDIAYDHRQGILHESIGNSIVETYKKTDPKRQAIWTTDTSRQNYILLLENAIGKRRAEWVTDRGGIHIKDRVIDPILVYLKAKLEDYVPSRDQKSLEVKGVMMGIVKEINDGIISRKINKFISGYFHMTDNVKKAITYKKKGCRKKPME